STHTAAVYVLLLCDLPTPNGAQHHHLDLDVATDDEAKGVSGNMRSDTASLLEAWEGDALTAESDYSFGHVHRLASNHDCTATLHCLVDRDLVMIESADFWKSGPEIETGEMRTEEIGTEVFYFPAANHVEKKGTSTNTQRMLQWRHQAVEPPGDARSELWFYY